MRWNSDGRVGRASFVQKKKGGGRGGGGNTMCARSTHSVRILLGMH